RPAAGTTAGSVAGRTGAGELKGRSAGGRVVVRRAVGVVHGGRQVLVHGARRAFVHGSDLRVSGRVEGRGGRRRRRTCVCRAALLLTDDRTHAAVLLGLLVHEDLLDLDEAALDVGHVVQLDVALRARG